MSMNKKRIICVDVNYGNKENCFKELVNLIKNKDNGYACFCNVHMLVEAYDDANFAKVVNSATYVFPDGFPIAKSFKWLYKINQERIAGMDFLPEFLSYCNSYKLNVSIVGSTNEILKVTKDKIAREFAEIKLKQLISPPFNKEWDNQLYINKINESNSDVVFVALGCPKQEKWMFDHYQKIDAFLFGIGGALPTYSNIVKRAPNWMQRYGLEWFYRLIKEPKRMFKRYFYTNSKFIRLLTVQLIKK